MRSLLGQYFNVVGSVILLSLIFCPLELLSPAEKGQRFSKRLFNLAYVPLFLTLALFIIQPISNILAARVLILSRGGILPPLTNPNGRVAGLILFAIAFAVLWDLWQYWLDRLQHTVPLLWQTHRFHHTETALNATSQTRHHFLSYLLSVVFYLPMLVIFGGQAPHYLAAFLMFRLWGFVNHANVRLNIGPLTPIISGPQWHRIHHSSLHEHQNRNFATSFPFIDVIFGTYYRPRKDEYPVTGLIAEEQVKLLREATIAPFVAWYQASLSQLNKFNSRRLIFKLMPRVERRS